jgi:uncharacterized protein YndB with AHSA1/START domain
MTINLEKSLNIDAPVAEVFALWTDVPSHPHLLPHAEGAHVDVTESVDGERLSWRIGGADVASTVTVQLEAAGDNGDHTKVTLSAHYPNGLGANSSVIQVATDMENSLENVARLLRGEAVVTRQDEAPEPDKEAWQAQHYPEVTASVAVLQRSMAAATDAWVASLNNAFQVYASLAWWPLQARR